MDTWMGNNHDPITLHKYAYGNADPVTYVDPTGNFGLGSFGVASNIQVSLSNLQIDVGFSILDAALNPESAANGPNYKALGLAVIGGPAAFKLLGLLSKKFRQACNSFDGETLVATEFGLVPIKDIKIGDKVWAYNEDSGENSLQEVVHLIQKEGQKDLVDIELVTGEFITATAGHPFFVMQTREWVDAGELTTSQLLQDFAGDSLGIAEIRTYREDARVYNLTVNNDHTYYAGVAGTLSHNANRCKPITSFNTKHFIYGDRFGGLHSVHGLGAGRRIVKRGPSDAQGLYSAQVEIRWGKGPNDVTIKNSTFFPDYWDEQKIIREIDSAYTSHIGNGGKGMKFTGRSASGILIDIELERWDGGVRVKTAFPRKK